MIFRAEDLARATGGQLVQTGPPGPVSTDSRRLASGQWFLALVGDRFDAHDFLPHAAAAGCAGAIARRVPDDWAAGFVRVEDPLLALQDLARFARSVFTGHVVAITGSAGKTTTRAMISRVLAPLGHVHATEGNLNNHIGLPLTILRSGVEVDIWVLELGMNHAGEIAVLADICLPTVRLITNVGAAHLEGLGSIEGVARAKGELFDSARPGDICCVNMDDPHIAGLPLPDGVRVLRYGSSPGCDVQLTDAVVDAETLSTRFRIQTPGGAVLGRVPSPGMHLAADATAAVAVGVACRVSPETMASNLALYEPVGMRQRIEELEGVRVINDAYNANPISMEASLRTLAAVRGSRRVALLGDMLELGSHSVAAHDDVLRLALSLDLDLIGVAGGHFAMAAQGHEHVIIAEDSIALGRAMHDKLQPGDVVLLKGSRGVAMERVLQELRGED